jgi:DNA repair photolyase
MVQREMEIMTLEDCQPAKTATGLTDNPPHEWLGRIAPAYRPVWEGRTPEEQRALGLYFLPHRSTKTMLAPTRPRVIKWYCPFAAQSDFPTGHRYCINVYTGCAHGCVYCYAASYEPEQVAGKRDYARLLAKDLDDLDRFNVPPAPVHISNSTDPFQPLEEQLGHTRQTLEGLLAHRNRFTTITLLTKNPALAASPAFARLLKALDELSPKHPLAATFAASGQPAVQVEVSLAFWRAEARMLWDPSAPSVASRQEGIRALRRDGIPVVLRIDPLFPRSPLPAGHALGPADAGLVGAQTLEDLESLVSFGKEHGVRHVVYSPAKIVLRRRYGLTPPMQNLLEVYRALSAPDKPLWRGNSWRLPRNVSEPYVTEPFLSLCGRLQMPAKFCMKNLLETP